MMSGHHNRMPAPTERLSLGNTDVRIPPMGVGTLAWGDRHLLGPVRGGYSEDDCWKAFEASLSAGIDFFDTAEVYGRGVSERLLGRFIRENSSQVTVATKFMTFPWRWTGRSVFRAIRGSLRRLGLPYVDLYQLHWPFPPISIERWMEGLADTVEEGLVRAIGVSNCNVEQMTRAQEALTRRGLTLATNQVQFSLLDCGAKRRALLAACLEMGVTLIAYSPLGMGMLTGKYTPQSPPRGFRRLRYGHRFSRMQPLFTLLKEMGDSHGGKTPGQVALNWVMCKGAVPIPGAKNDRQARENAGALGWKLKDDEVIALDEASQGV